MSENEKQKQPVSSETNNQQVANTTQPARRRLLKGTVAIPIIMTLHSGAALARTSNMAGVAPEENACKVTTDSGQKYACALPDPNEDQSAAPPYDLGDSPNVFLADSPQACTDQGGILLSAGALSSFSTEITCDPSL